jgi:threonine dehydratase
VIPTVEHVEAARRRIAPHVLRTPLVPSRAFGPDVLLKLETLQPVGAFKLRGATNRLLALDAEERRRGVVTMSTGNHGRAVAYAAARLGMRAVVCLSRLVPQNKVAAIRALGAEVRVVGSSQDEAAETADALVRDEGLVLVPPFDDPFVVAGQGTIGLELAEDGALDTVLVPLSGGGLVAGIALALKARSPATRVVAVSMEHGAAMAASLAAGRPVLVAEEETLADSLGGGIGLDNRVTFALVRDLVDEVVLVDEASIAEGMRVLFREEGLVTEGAAAVGIAALLSGRIPNAGRAAAIISGRNVDPEAFLRIISAPPPRHPREGEDPSHRELRPTSSSRTDGSSPSRG